MLAFFNLIITIVSYIAIHLTKSKVRTQWIEKLNQFNTTEKTGEMLKYLVKRRKTGLNNHVRKNLLFKLLQRVFKKLMKCIKIKAEICTFASR